MTPPPIEILVHVSAPSRGADDARYRIKARGFLNFETVTRYTICPLEPPYGEYPSGKQSTQETNSANEPFLLDLLPSQITGVPLSSVQKGLKTPAQIEKAPDHRLKTPATISRPAPLSDLQWTSVKETPHLLIERTPALPRPRTAPTNATPSNRVQPLRRTQSDSWHTPPSVIPDSQPTPATSTPRRPEVSSSPYLKRPFDSSSPSPTRPEDSPSRKRQHSHLLSSPPVEGRVVNRPLAFGPPLPPSSPLSKEPATNLLPTSVPVPPSSPPKQAQSSSPPPPSTRKVHDIHPRRPTPSTTHFKTHLTRSLSLICDQLPLAQFYKPLNTTRAIETLERGHWLIQLSTFDAALRTKFWNYLVDFVGNHRQAGWGTWCLREWVEVDSREQDGKDMSGKQEEVVRIYCWGEVVGEIWVLLFMASSRKVKGAGARWIDAGGEVVVIMK